MFILQFFLTMFCCSIGVSLHNKRKLHWTVKLFLVSVVFQFVALLLLLIYYSSYASTGIMDDGALITGNLFMSFSDTLMVVLLILLAKGWTIVRRKISIPGRIKIAVFGMTYFLSSVTVVAWRFKALDVADSLYYYDSAAGIMFVVVRLLGVVWFNYAAKTTVKQFPTKKKRFYYRFTIVFSIWLGAIPLGIAIGGAFDD